MPDKYIVNMTEKTTPEDTNLLVIEDAVDTKKVTFANLVKPIKDMIATHLAEYVHIGKNEFVQVRNINHQTIPNNEHVKIFFNQIDYDSFGSFDLQQATKLTCKKSGAYAVLANVMFTPGSAGLRRVRILLNGSVRLQDDRLPTASVTNITLTGILVIAENDVVEVEVLQNNGSSLDVQTIGNYTPTLRLMRVG